MSSLEILAIAVLFVVSWFTTAFLVSAIGGWWELAEHYRTQAPAPPALHEAVDQSEEPRFLLSEVALIGDDERRIGG